ncbi:MAG: protein kinase [Pseudomonadales bacterium]|nr:protein kinase [Pseudomonadales bacterium]
MKQNSQPAKPIPGYRIIRPIGQGGMASVYLAIQDSINRVVALKVLNPVLTADPSFAARFLREARIAGQLSHPHIVQVYDVGVEDGQYFLTMEYCEGASLKQRIADGMTVSDAISYTLSLASAIDFAHKKGFIHRDIKADNVMFRKDGTIVLADFGIARPTDSDTRMTVTGSIMGTPSYMSPEQAKGEKLDGRSDLYSLGVLFYELLTAQLPFSGGSSFAIGLKHINEPVPLLPESLSRWQHFVDKALAKEFSQRYQSGSSFVDALTLTQQEAESHGRNILSFNVKDLTEKPTDRIADVVHSLPTTVRGTGFSKATIALTAVGAMGLTATIAWFGYNSNNYVSTDSPSPITEFSSNEKPRLLAKKNTSIQVTEEKDKQDKIRKMLLKAKGLEALGKHLTANGQGAYSLYQKVFDLDPNNSEAISNSQHILHSQYLKIENAIDQNQWQGAEATLALVAKIDPELPRVAELNLALSQAKQLQLKIQIQQRNLQRQQEIDAQKKTQIEEEVRLEKEKQISQEKHVLQKEKERALAEKKNNVQQTQSNIKHLLNPLHLSIEKLDAAYNQYSTLNQLDPTNQYTNKLFRSIIESYAQLAESQLLDDQRELSKKTLTQGLKLDPGNPQLLKIKKESEISKRNINFGGF